MRISTKTYAAVKVMVVGVDQDRVKAELALYNKLSNSRDDCESPSYFLGLESHFGLYGPNGHHICHVFRPMGPHLSQFLRGSSQFLRGIILTGRYLLPKYIAKRILREIFLELQPLHHAGITHGDLHLENILLNIKSDEFDATPASSLRQTVEDGDALKRLDGKKDL